MGSKLKTISLDGQTSKIADNIPNFSQWVRSKLLEHAERITPTTRYSYACNTCERVFIFDYDKGDTDMCRNKMCANYGYEIKRVIQ